MSGLTYSSAQIEDEFYFGASPPKREDLLEFIVDYFTKFRKILGNCLTCLRKRVPEYKGGEGLCG